MTLLDNGGQIARAEGAPDEASWQEFLRDIGVAQAQPVASPRLTCRWVADPASPGRMISVWEDRTGA